MKIKNLLNSKNLIITFIIIISIFSIFFLITILVSKNQIGLSEYKSKSYSLKYDRTWELKENQPNKISFEHATGSTMDISVMTLDSRYSESNIELLLEEIQYSIEDQNPDYKLIVGNKEKVTSKKYDGYQLLYETKDNQAMIVVGKKAEKLFIVNYVADNEYFDILLDSAKNIISNFQLLDESIELSSSIKTIKTNPITYSKKSDSCDYSITNEYEILDNHYNVKYKIPKCFNMTSFDSQYGYYKLYGKTISDYISIETNIVYKNMYEYVTDETSYSALAYTIKSLKDNDSYENVKVTNEEIKGDMSGYIYRITYDYISAIGKEYNKTYETIYLVYSLDYLRTFVISLESINMGITEELVNSIVIGDYIKYGDHIYRDSTDGYLVDTMNVFVKSSKEEYYELKYSIPNKYKELDNSSNKYVNRYFGLEYDEESEDYNYNVDLYLSDFYTKNSYIEGIQKQYNYDTYKNATLSYVNSITNNNITFSYYVGRYTVKSSNITNREVYLLTELDSGGIYVVKISSDKKEISTDLINDFTSISVSKIKK